MPKVAYHLVQPEAHTSRVVFASPHSGRDYSWNFLRHTALDEVTIRSSEDAFVDRLFDCAPQFGAVFIKAGAPRAYIDLNRSAEELDPALIEGVRRQTHNPRVASGLGVVPRVVANGRPIYQGKLPLAEAERRIAQFWHPYHDQLRKLMQQAHARFGEAILVDCHSMPHEALDGVAKSTARRPQIVLGDRFGASASQTVVDQIEAAFTDAGLIVARNTPFAGAYITQAYGRPSRKQHAVQIEIDRSIYMDERTIRPNANFHNFRKLLRSVIAEIAATGQAKDMPLAAE
ncbi:MULTISPECIES: N-formylglutamate amidohydrolase [Marivita]|jgi:N-formylglutamate deformylase|uniref:N-formylglutamate amidohydrolase n=1 Tax=Marivita cryptomonadis TaxID=505252 RepID=A0A9Q2NZE4_9RHOB|nr:MULTISPECIES: N-formylglutamate amidohydrolase [Marivita]MCR9168766.1 N-formylglutamate amidohydrolase [Paracoccaceae bacterium]MBM2319847.1 N-formylglutamate amidohydrolase [Marivita cryptomonadis]MBM2329426.1 N-formylglutamate amidohydrolase [Marivita cryptomonadis]MBM2339014.1 N-formylglutamate amidohydrolase [Marivita cryptomonadis]MBM2343672.1 N-formylglutamate amidohydrolase [Marivita cryptomonadis]